MCTRARYLRVARRFRVPNRSDLRPSSVWLGCCSLTIMFSNYSASASFDELVDATGQPRDGVQRVGKLLARLGIDELRSRQGAAEAMIRALGITFTIYAQSNDIDREWPFDIIPRVIAQKEWDRIARGLEQRLRTLNLFIDDLYNGQRVVQAGIFPGELPGQLQKLPRGLPRRKTEVRRLGAYLRHGSGARPRRHRVRARGQSENSLRRFVHAGKS